MLLLLCLLLATHATAIDTQCSSNQLGDNFTELKVNEQQNHFIDVNYHNEYQEHFLNLLQEQKDFFIRAFNQTLIQTYFDMKLVNQTSDITYQSLSFSTQANSSYKYSIPLPPIPDSWRCLMELGSFILEITSQKYLPLLQAMGKDVDDYGSYNKCHQLQNQNRSRYVVLTLNTTAIPIKIVFGLCLPRNCTQEMYDPVMASATNLLNKYVPSLAQNIEAAKNFIPIQTKFQVYVLIPTEFKEQVRDEKESGMYAMLVFVGLLFLLMISAGIYEYFENLNYHPRDDDGDGNKQLLLEQEEEEQHQQNQGEIFSQQSRNNARQRVLRKLKPSTVESINSIQFNNRSSSALLSRASTNFTDFSRFDSNSLSNNTYHQNSNLSSHVQQRPSSIQPFQVNQQFKKKQNLQPPVNIDKSSWYALLFRSFSFKRNWTFLGEPRETPTPQLNIFDGIKIICMIWIVALSTCFFIPTGSMYNPWTFFDLFKNIMFTVTVSASIAFDVFVSLSALFAFYRIHQYAQENNGKINPCLHYFMRWLRLAPLYYFVFLCGWLIGSFWGDGPVWSRYEMGFHECGEYWWTIFLFVGNFVPWQRINNEGCMLWNWAICCDFQFFIIVPLFVFLWMKWPKCCYFVLTVLGLGNIGAYVYIFTYILNMKAGVMSPYNFHLMQDVVSKPYTKMCSFALGIGMAIILINLKRYQRRREQIKQIESKRNNRIQASDIDKPNENQVKLDKLKKEFPIMDKLHSDGGTIYWVIGYMIGLFLILFLILITFKANSEPWTWPQWVNAVYLSFSRPLFLIGIFIFALAMFVGRLQGIRNILGHETMTPIARLTFCVYLVHPIIISSFYSTVDTSQYLRLLSVIGYFLAFILMSVLVSVVLFLLVEAPISHQFRGILSSWCGKREGKQFEKMNY